MLQFLLDLSVTTIETNLKSRKASLTNKDDDIYKSEALNWKDKRTLTHVVCQNWILMHCKYKIVSKFVGKLIKYMILFKDILTFLELDFRDASLNTLYLVVIGINM